MTPLQMTSTRIEEVDARWPGWKDIIRPAATISADAAVWTIDRAHVAWKVGKAHQVQFRARAAEARTRSARPRRPRRIVPASIAPTPAATTMPPLPIQPIPENWDPRDYAQDSKGTSPCNC